MMIRMEERGSTWVDTRVRRGAEGNIPIDQFTSIPTFNEYVD